MRTDAAPDPDDHDMVTQLLGRRPMGEYAVVVRRVEHREPVVIRNAPALADGTPMPTRYWLVGDRERARIGRLEAAGGVRRAEAEVDGGELEAAHQRYAVQRAQAVDPGSSPSTAKAYASTRSRRASRSTRNETASLTARFPQG
ncbi:MAG: DUF501 domain-containing protein, partial [Acidimicrobiales bacterium]